jgi:hypothetical protein
MSNFGIQLAAVNFGAARGRSEAAKQEVQRPKDPDLGRDYGR